MEYSFLEVSEQAKNINFSRIFNLLLIQSKKNLICKIS